jgi:hypothetical protein
VAGINTTYLSSSSPVSIIISLYVITFTIGWSIQAAAYKYLILLTAPATAKISAISGIGTGSARSIITLNTPSGG